MTAGADTIRLADQMRRSGCPDARMLRDEAASESPHDGGTVIFRHAAVHAGVVTPTSVDRFNFCPTCGSRLDWPGREAEDPRGEGTDGDR